MLLAGCATGLTSLPLPAPGKTDHGISLTAEFSNALNLPAQAKVRLNGADIGQVESIRAQNFNALVTMRLRADVPLPIGTTAELRSATPLGDVFVAIRTNPNPAPGAPLLRDGDNLTSSSTSAAATIEQVLGSAALLVNGGTIRHLVSIVNGAGSAMGGRGEKLAELLQQSNTLIARLNSRSGEIDAALRSTSELTARISERQNTLNEVISAAGPAMTVIGNNTSQLADLTDGVARITLQLNRFPSVQGTDSRSIIKDLNDLSALFNELVLDPTVDLNVLNRAIQSLVAVTGGAALSGSGVITQLAFGALPDMNYPGDPGFHGADGTDYHAMIASLRYEYNLLLSRVYGPEHRPR